MWSASSFRAAGVTGRSPEREGNTARHNPEVTSACLLSGHTPCAPHVLAISLRIQRQHYKEDMRKTISPLLIGLCRNTEGQDVAEYAIMLAVVLVIVVGTVRMIGSNAGIVFSQVASGIQ